MGEASVPVSLELVDDLEEVFLHEVVEQDMAVDKFDPRSVVEPCIRIARRPYLFWAPANWGPWMVERDLIGVIV